MIDLIVKLLLDFSCIMNVDVLPRTCTVYSHYLACEFFSCMKGLIKSQINCTFGDQ